MTPLLTACFCSYNRADRLVELITQLSRQQCTEAFEILVINNNSTDNTLAVLEDLSGKIHTPFRYVTETEQGIPYARNRALAECKTDILLFMDDDELPKPGLLQAAVDAFADTEADCVGGKVKNEFLPGIRPKWLGDELLGFLAETDYGDQEFWIENYDTPLWTANIAYRMQLFKQQSDLKFDIRYNRLGNTIGGGSDQVLFKELLSMKVKILYCPDMVVIHHVESWRLKQSYFLKLHYLGGRRRGRFELPEYDKKLFGIPVFLFKQALAQTFKAIKMYIFNHPNRVRQGMNASHAFGLIAGSFIKHLK